MWKRLWESWKRIAHAIGNFQARVLLTLLYVVLVLPFGLAVRLFADPLRIRKRPRAWNEQVRGGADLDWARRQW